MGNLCRSIRELVFPGCEGMLHNKVSRDDTLHEGAVASTLIEKRRVKKGNLHQKGGKT